MSAALPLCVALLVGAAAPAAAQGAFEFDVRADEVEIIDGVLQAEGDVRARSGSLLLRAPRLEFSQATRRATAGPGVFVVDGLRLLTARSLVLDVGTQGMTLEDGRLVVKRDTTAEALLAAVDSADPGKARRLGRDAIELRATRIRREGENTFEAEKLRLTTCACGDDCRPVLSVSASSARVTPGESALLRWPVFRILDVPVLPLPVPVSFPLVDRRTGLLFPAFGFGGPGGASVELPYFVTLGESADVTLRPRYFAGPSVSDELRADIGAGKAVPPVGIAGPGLETELRWRPAVDASGSLRSTWFHDTYDFNPERPVFGRERFDVEGRHAHGLAGGRLAARGRVLSDPMLLADTGLVEQVRELDYLRSQIGWSRPGLAGGVAVQAGVLQRLRVEGQRFGDTFDALAPLPRLSALAATSLGPVLADGWLRATSWWAPRRAVGARVPRIDADLALGQTLPLVARRRGLVVLEAGERLALVRELEGTAEQLARFGAFAGLAASTRIWRSFGGGWLHEIVPSLHVRGYAAAGRPFRDALFAEADAGSPLSETDIAQPPGTAAQAILRVGSNLSQQGFTPLSLWAEVHAGLPADAGQYVAGLDHRFRQWLGGAHLSLLAAWDAEQGQVALAAGRWSARPAGTSLSLGATYRNSSSSDRFGAGEDMLFATPEARSVAAGQEAVFDGTVQIPLGAQLRLNAGALFIRNLEARRPTTQQYSAGINWDVSGCIRLALGVLWNPADVGWPRLGFEFSLGELDTTGLTGAPTLAPPAPAGTR